MRIQKPRAGIGVPEENVLNLRKMTDKSSQPKQTVRQSALENFFSAGTQTVGKAIHHLTVPAEDAPVHRRPRGGQKRKENHSDISWKLSTPRFKHLLVFVLLLCALLVPFFVVSAIQKAKEVKGKVLGASTDAYGQFIDASQYIASQQYDKASSTFEQAKNGFVAAQEEFRSFGGLTTDIVKAASSESRSAEHLLTAGEYMSKAGEELASLLQAIDTRVPGSDETVTRDFSVLTERLPLLEHYVRVTIDNLSLVRPEDIPESSRETFQTLAGVLPALRDNFSYLEKASQALLSVLGAHTQQRYLVLFENNRELRPTGGFIGSLALIDVYQGAVERIEVPRGGSYDIAGQFPEKIVSPNPLHLVNPYWNIQDANWFPDFPTSAKKVMWFYEKSGGPSVDGVIALTPTFIERLLDVTGSIDMRDPYGTVISASNFVAYAQSYSDAHRESGEPKAFIADLLPVLLNKLFSVSPDKLVDLLGALSTSFDQRDLLLFSKNQETQQRIEDLRWSGAILPAEKDFLSVVTTNIGGGKTDASMQQLILHEARVLDDGSIIDTVKLTRVHNGSKNDAFAGVDNVSYVRFYVPEGSELIDAQGFSVIPQSRFKEPDLDAGQDEDLLAIEKNPSLDERTQTRVTHEFGKTVFGNWVVVRPGQQATVEVSYKLPFSLRTGFLTHPTDTYSLLVQRQPGSAPTGLVSFLRLPSQYVLAWSQSGESSQNQLKFSADLTSDQIYTALIERQ